MELVVTVKFPQMKEPKTEEKEGTISDLFKIFFFFKFTATLYNQKPIIVSTSPLVLYKWYDLEFRITCNPVSNKQAGTFHLISLQSENVYCTATFPQSNLPLTTDNILKIYKM